MFSRILVTNSSEFQFKSSIVLFCEIEGLVEKFWESKLTDTIIPKGETIAMGKLNCPDELPNTANFVVSIILTLEKSSEIQSQDTFLILKSRIKKSTAGEKVYAYASSFPENLALTKPQWHKGNSKNYFFTNFFGKILKISYKLSWNDNTTFVIDQLQETPVFCNLQQPGKEFIIEDFYENQWKTNALGRSKYSHNPMSVHTDRPSYSAVDGRPILPKSQIMTPTPLWLWADEWHLDNHTDGEDGWIYVDDWKSSTFKPENSTKFRFRRWIRTRVLKKAFDDGGSKTLEFISNHYRITVNSLKEFMPPFLKALKKEVQSSPGNFDLRSTAAIPSPRLRRELKIFSV